LPYALENFSIQLIKKSATLFIRHGFPIVGHKQHPLSENRIQKDARFFIFWLITAPVVAATHGEQSIIALGEVAEKWDEPGLRIGETVRHEKDSASPYR
jgi:hypothetical protein